MILSVRLSLSQPAPLGAVCEHACDTRRAAFEHFGMPTVRGHPDCPGYIIPRGTNYGVRIGGGHTCCAVPCAQVV